MTASGRKVSVRYEASGVVKPTFAAVHRRYCRSRAAPALNLSFTFGGSRPVSDADRARRDHEAGEHAMAGQPLMQEQTADQGGEDHTGLAEG